MKFMLIIIGAITHCNGCNFTFEEEDTTVNDKGIRFHEISKFDFSNGKYQYSLFPESSVMTISQKGTLHFKRGTDREWLCKVPDLSLNCNCKEFICKISVGIWIQERSAIKHEPPTRKQFVICIKDKNDNCPKLPNVIHKTMIESAKIGFKIPLPVASDLDSTFNSKAIYELKCNAESLKFKLQMQDSNTPLLELISPLDHETLTSHSCQLKACEANCCNSASLTITVTDDNDFSPTWTVTSWHVSILENSPPNTQIMQLSATDLDSTFNQLTYTMDGSKQDLFLVEILSGIIRLAGYLDYETMIDKTILLSVKVTDNGIFQPRSATGTVTISVSDVNDNRPIINIKNNIVSLKENIPQVYLGYMTVSDADSGINGIVTCSVIHPEDKIMLKSSTMSSNDVIYDIYSSSSFDHETTPRVPVKIICNDMGQPKLSSEITLLLQIQDVDDNNVKFIKKIFAAGIDEEREIGFFITQIEAIDKDSTSTLEYLLSNNNDAALVEIDRNTGVIRTNKVFDREMKSEYEIGVMVREKHSLSNKTDSATVLIKVLDINDNDPKFEQLYSFSVSESKDINFEIGKVVAHDPDLRNNGTVVYSQQRSDDSNHFLFFVDQIGKIRLFHRLDYETQTLHHLIVLASDLGRPVARTTTTTVIISVIDENDNPPKFKHKYFDIDIGCHTRFLSRDLIPATDNDTDSKNRLMKFHISMITPISMEKYFRIDNQTGEITVSIDQPNGIACSLIPKLIKMKIMVSDPTEAIFKDYCILHLKLSQPYSKLISNDQITDNKRKDSDRKTIDKEPSLLNPNQFDSSLFLVVILIVFSVILLLLLTCVAVFTKRCKEVDQEQISKVENDHSNHQSGGKFEKTNLSMSKKGNNNNRAEFQMFSHKLPDGGMTTNSLFSEHSLKKLEDRSSVEEDRNEYQLLGQSHEYRNLNTQQKYFNNYIVSSPDSSSTHPLILSTDIGNTFLAVKPTVSTSFV